MNTPTTCDFCTSPNVVYRDADGPYVSCGNHFMRLTTPRAADPISDAMAAQLRDMLSDDGIVYHDD